MTQKLRIAPEAEAELAAAALWYEAKRPGLGADLIATVDRVLEDIADRPRSFPVWHTAPAYRRAVLPRFPYIVFFSETAGVIDVFAFAHAKRRPGYWQSR